MDIPLHLVDTTTFFENHSVYAHYGCVLLRSVLGMYMLLAYNALDAERFTFIGLFGFLLAIFVAKSIMMPKKTWKVYARIVLTLTVSILLLLFAEKETAKHVVGTLLIVDAMMGIQSRYTATLLYR